MIDNSLHAAQFNRLSQQIIDTGGLCQIQAGTSAAQTIGSSGTHILITLNFDVDTSAHINAYGTLGITHCGVGGVNHTVSITIDGTDEASQNSQTCPFSAALALQNFAIGAGSHTAELRYFTATVGLGEDDLSAGQLTLEVCP